MSQTDGQACRRAETQSLLGHTVGGLGDNYKSVCCILYIEFAHTILNSTCLLRCQPDKIVLSVQTERDVSARFTDVQNEVARLTSFIRQRSDTTAQPTNSGQW